MKIGKKIQVQWLRIPAQWENVYQEINWKPKNDYKRWLSLLIFGSTLLLLALFLFHISTHINSRAFRGLGVMVGILVLRICMEFAIKKRKLPVDKALMDYKEQLLGYYETKKYIYFITTPILLAGYIYGFAMLLSIFEQDVLRDLYFHIIYSSWIIFLGMSVLIGVQLRAELEILKSLIADFKAS
jgi:hypothetical protein